MSELVNPIVKVRFKEGITSLTECFYDCQKILKFSGNLFSRCSEVTDFNYCFQNCLPWASKSMAYIPKGLFSNCSNVTSFEGCFWRCYSIRNLPDDLFENNKEVNSFSSIFAYCNFSIIPENLFSSNTKVANFSNCFYSCQNLEVMPIDNDDTPIYNRNSPGKEGYSIVTKFSNCFQSCTKLQELYPDIPEDWK